MARAPIVLLLLAVLLSAVHARADVAPPNTADCQTKQLGAACMLDNGSMGFCTAMTCNRPLPDGGTQSSACNVCQPGDGGTTTTTTTTTTTGSCSMATRAGGAFGLFGLALGAAALVGRRRRHSS